MTDLELNVGPHALAARLHQPPARVQAAVVVAHGLFSSMASQKLTRLCQALASQGCLVLQYDSLGCGDSPGRIEETTLESRCQEVLAGAAHLARLAPSAPLVYVGSSLGGSASILAASRRAPARLALWSTPIDLARLRLRLQDNPDYAHLTALAQETRFDDLSGFLPTLTGSLWVHGQKDEVAPVEQARQGHGLAAPPKQLLLLPGADHRLSRLEDQDQATRLTLDWVLSAKD